MRWAIFSIEIAGQGLVSAYVTVMTSTYEVFLIQTIQCFTGRDIAFIILTV